MHARNKCSVVKSWRVELQETESYVNGMARRRSLEVVERGGMEASYQLEIRRRMQLRAQF
jgi:hypothetical protein